MARKLLRQKKDSPSPVDIKSLILEALPFIELDDKAELSREEIAVLLGSTTPRVRIQ